MATYITLFVLLIMTLISATIPTDSISLESQDLVVATQEMVKANYFTFVMLINMSPLDQRFQGNITFLMPNDRMLSRVSIARDSVSDFLLRHSIPSPLLFDHLQRIPSGSTIPSFEPEYILSISNKGRKNFTLNNVKIISPNICTAGSSIRCHGVDGVLADIDTNNIPSPTCSGSGASPAIVASPLAPSLPSSAFPVGDHNQIPLPAPPLDQRVGRPKRSGSSYPGSQLHLFKFLMTSVLVPIAGFGFLF